MNNTKDNTYVLYHGNCCDGFGAALAAWKQFGVNASYIPVLYGKPMPEMKHGSDVYIVDFSYPADQLVLLTQRMKSVTVLDHHATAHKDLCGAAFLDLGHSVQNDIDGIRVYANGSILLVKFNMAKSGAVLAWEHFFPKTPAPKFFLYLQDRDLWHFKLPRSREISAFTLSLSKDFNVWNHVMEAWDFSESNFREDMLVGLGCEKLKERMVEEMLANKRTVLIDTKYQTITFDVPFGGYHGYPEGVYVAPCCNATVFFSEVGEALLQKDPEAKFAVYYLDRGDKKRQWGIRSRKDFDAATLIAKPMGGGGHPQACGFTTDIPK